MKREWMIHDYGAVWLVNCDDVGLEFPKYAFPGVEDVQRFVRPRLAVKDDPRTESKREGQEL